MKQTGVLRIGKNAAEKKAAGKCVTAFCRNRLPRSQRRKGNIHCSKCMMRRWRTNNPLASLLLMWRDRARRKQVPFDLTLEYVQWLVTDTGYLDNRGVFKGCLHLDRKIPALGYTRGNVQVLTAEDNVAKGNRERHEPF